MIRYPITARLLNQLIDAEDINWRSDAELRVECFRKLGRYEEASSIWSRIKAVYMRIQHNKCAYCERGLPAEGYGKVEHDVEHFRPKNPVKKWPTDGISRERKIEYGFATGKPFGKGYFLLAYEPLNYVTACKTCNTPLKSNYFPIAGTRNPDDLKAEKPFLVYPLGSVDADPEKVLTFDGIIPVPVKRSGHTFRRAQVIIDFFELDTREELLRQRSQQIRNLMTALIVFESQETSENRDLASETLADLQAPHSPHTSCVRAFYSLYYRDRTLAMALFVEIREYLNRQS